MGERRRSSLRPGGPAAWAAAKDAQIIAGGVRSNEQIAKELELGAALAEYHLQMLEKALVIEQTEGGWRATTTGLLYLENVETRH